MSDLPNYEQLMRPVLDFYKDGEEYDRFSAIQHIVKLLKLNPEEYTRTSSGQPMIYGRVGWAHTYLKQAKLLDSPRRGRYKITPRGQEVLDSGVDINSTYLMRFPEFRDFATRKNDNVADSETASEVVSSSETPSERMASALLEQNKVLKEEVLTALRNVDAFYFEKIVADLLQTMGYGDAHVTQRTNDGGIDAIVNEDTLGISKIYAQAKRYAADNRVNRKELQNFVGALTIHNISKGVFITTSSFYAQAEEDLSRTQKSIVLIDGDKLAGLMVEHNLGVTIEKTYAIKRLDSDYYEAE